MTDRYVEVSGDGPVVTVTLARPSKRNTLGIEVIRALADTFTELADTAAVGIVLAADGPVFSAGHDFSEMAGATVADAEQLFEACTEMMELIPRIPQVVIARVHALATAAGCQLVAACDLAVAAESAGFALPGGKGGLFCHTPLVAVARQIGRKRALEMAMTGDVVPARVAAEWGLINRCVPDDQLDAAVDDLMARATRGSASSKAAGKRAFYEQIEMDRSSAYEFAIGVMSAGVATPDAQEGIQAFLDKRPARFGPRA